MDANSEIMQDHFVVDRDHVCKLHENYRTLIIHRKDVIDQIAAVFILQGYLDSRNECRRNE